MKSINSKNTLDGNSSGLITWTGDCIPCLKIKTGDNLNVVVYTIAEKICELTSPMDLSSLSLQCALDIFDKDEPANRTIANVFQLLLDNDCGLKELIDNIQTQIDGIGGDNLVLRLGCLADYYKDNNGNVLETYTTKTILQNLIDELCTLKGSYTTLSSDLTALKNKVDNLHIPSGNEVVVTTCISSSKPVSQAVIELGSDYCDFKAIVGNASQIQTALAKQTSAMNTLMSTTSGWVTTPTNIAQGLNNVYLMFSNLLPRTAANELCCGGSCDDIKCGFIADIENDTVILKFTSGAGTSIPSGFVDTGSVLTITDQSGLSTSVNIAVTQNGQTDEIDLSMFTIGSVLDFNIDLKMNNEGISCQKCINKTVKYVSSGCCVITAISEVTIVYSTIASNILT